MTEKAKFVRFLANGQPLYGRLEGEVVIALEGDLFNGYREKGESYYLKEVKLLAPCQPSKAVCVGLNYRSHAAEMRQPLPKEPVLFLKPSTSLIGPEEEIIYWPGIGRLDFEAELAVVIGKVCHKIKEEEAQQYILGYTIANDVTARDLQKKDGQWTRAKSFDTFLPLGPYIVTGIAPDDLLIQARLNGELKQNSRTSQLIFSVPYLVSFISQVMTLLPGDVILTGTPEGVGPMQVGDTIEIYIEELGSLTNRVAAPKE